MNKFTVIKGGSGVTDHVAVDSFDLSKALVALEGTRAPNIRIRKRLMLDALQYASIAIHRGEWQRADDLLCRVLLSLENLRKRDK